MAFARPFLPERAAAAVAAIGGNRELVVLLDRSASMGYGDHWRARSAAARDAIGSIGMNDKATLVLFDRNTEEAVRATSDRGRLESALGAAKVTAAATRYGPALKLAESILARSTLQRREAILISDFQKSGWTGAEDVHFSESMQLTPVVGRDRQDDEHLRAVGHLRAFVVLGPGTHHASRPASPTRRSDSATDVPVTLEVDGHADREPER